MHYEKFLLSCQGLDTGGSGQSGLLDDATCPATLIAKSSQNHSYR